MLSGSQSGAHAVCTYVPATTHAHANVIRMHVHVHAVECMVAVRIYVVPISGIRTMNLQ